jgi:hypothetical protein
MEIVVNHLTRMAPPHVCVAGVDEATGEHIRPVLRTERLTTTDLESNGGLFCIGQRVSLGAVRDVGSPPEVEDREFARSTATSIGTLSPGDLWSLLESVQQHSLESIFGPLLVTRGPGRTLPVGCGPASLGCLRPAHAPRLYVSNEGKVRMKLRDAGENLNLGVTDLRLYQDDLRTPRTEIIGRVSEEIRKGTAVILAVGVGRPYPTDDPQHWLQVNNVHIEGASLDLRS